MHGCLCHGSCFVLCHGIDATGNHDTHNRLSIYDISTVCTSILRISSASIRIRICFLASIGKHQQRNICCSIPIRQPLSALLVCRIRFSWAFRWLHAISFCLPSGCIFCYERTMQSRCVIGCRNIHIISDHPSIPIPAMDIDRLACVANILYCNSVLLQPFFRSCFCICIRIGCCYFLCPDIVRQRKSRGYR